MPDAPAARAPLIDVDKRVAFALVATLFFSWALAASLNDVLIRHFQKALDLTRAQSSLVQFAFYIGYFCAALPAGWVMRRLGFKTGILAGLGLYALGALLFWPAAEARVYAMFLGALFVIACGLAFLETAANPYIAVLGDVRTGAARLNLAQSCYGLGAIVGPFIGGLFILSGVEHSGTELAAMTPAALTAYRVGEARTVEWPYAAVAAFVALLAVLVARAKLPRVTGDGADAVARGGARDALRHRHLVAGIVAQFFYVGAQVTIWSYFIDFGKEEMPNLSEKQLAFLLSGSLAALMIGRLTGALLMRRIAPERLLSVYAVANIMLCLVAIGIGGAAAVAALWLASFFMSIMFPTIFALAVRDLGPATKMGGSLLIMSIIGGALFPALAGVAADSAGSLRPAMTVPLAGFAVVLWYALSGSRLSLQASSV